MMCISSALIRNCHNSRIKGLLDKQVNEVQKVHKVRTYLQLPLRQWGASNVYLLVLSKGGFSLTSNETFFIDSINLQLKLQSFVN